MAYNQTLFANLKVIDASIARQLALRKPIDYRLRAINHPISSRASISSTSISSSHPSSSAVELSCIEEEMYYSAANMGQVMTLPFRMKQDKLNTSFEQNSQRIREQNRLTYPSLALDDAHRRILPEQYSSAPSELSETSGLASLLERVRGIGRNVSRRMIRRSLSSPALSREGYENTTPRETNRRMSSASMSRPSGSDADISSYAGSTDYADTNRGEEGGIALSEIAVEEHVPDIITQV